MIYLTPEMQEKIKNADVTVFSDILQLLYQDPNTKTFKSENEVKIILTECKEDISPGKFLIASYFLYHVLYHQKFFDSKNLLKILAKRLEKDISASQMKFFQVLKILCDKTPIDIKVLTSIFDVQSPDPSDEIAKHLVSVQYHLENSKNSKLDPNIYQQCKQSLIAVIKRIDENQLLPLYRFLETQLSTLKSRVEQQSVENRDLCCLLAHVHYVNSKNQDINNSELLNEAITYYEEANKQTNRNELNLPTEEINTNIGGFQYDSMQPPADLLKNTDVSSQPRYLSLYSDVSIDPLSSDSNSDDTESKQETESLQLNFEIRLLKSEFPEALYIRAKQSSENKSINFAEYKQIIIDLKKAMSFRHKDSENLLNQINESLFGGYIIASMKDDTETAVEIFHLITELQSPGSVYEMKYKVWKEELKNTFIKKNDGDKLLDAMLKGCIEIKKKQGVVSLTLTLEDYEKLGEKLESFINEEKDILKKEFYLIQMIKAYLERLRQKIPSEKEYLSTKISTLLLKWSPVFSVSKEISKLDETISILLTLRETISMDEQNIFWRQAHEYLIHALKKQIYLRKMANFDLFISNMQRLAIIPRDKLLEAEDNNVLEDWFSDALRVVFEHFNKIFQNIVQKTANLEDLKTLYKNFAFIAENGNYLMGLQNQIYNYKTYIGAVIEELSVAQEFVKHKSSIELAGSFKGYVPKLTNVPNVDWKSWVLCNVLPHTFNLISLYISKCFENLTSYTRVDREEIRNIINDSTGLRLLSELCLLENTPVIFLTKAKVFAQTNIFDFISNKISYNQEFDKLIDQYYPACRQKGPIYYLAAGLNDTIGWYAYSAYDSLTRISPLTTMVFLCRCILVCQLNLADEMVKIENNSKIYPVSTLNEFIVDFLNILRIFPNQIPQKTQLFIIEQINKMVSNFETDQNKKDKSWRLTQEKELNTNFDILTKIFWDIQPKPDQGLHLIPQLHTPEEMQVSEPPQIPDDFKSQEFSQMLQPTTMEQLQLALQYEKMKLDRIEKEIQLQNLNKTLVHDQIYLEQLTIQRMQLQLQLQQQSQQTAPEKNSRSPIYVEEPFGSFFSKNASQISAFDQSEDKRNIPGSDMG